MRLHDAADLAALPRTKWNIQQPSLEEEDREVAEHLDLILVPGLAFTKVTNAFKRKHKILALLGYT